LAVGAGVTGQAQEGARGCVGPFLTSDDACGTAAAADAVDCGPAWGMGTPWPRPPSSALYDPKCCWLAVDECGRDDCDSTTIVSPPKLLSDTELTSPVGRGL